MNDSHTHTDNAKMVYEEDRNIQSTPKMAAVNLPNFLSIGNPEKRLCLGVPFTNMV